jgi:hypothetical protein
LLDALVCGDHWLRRSHELSAGDSVALLCGLSQLDVSFHGANSRALGAPAQLRGRLIGLFNMSHKGLRAFGGVTVDVIGGLIGIHRSLAVSAMILLAITVALFALVIPGQRSGEYR